MSKWIIILSCFFLGCTTDYHEYRIVLPDSYTAACEEPYSVCTDQAHAAYCVDIEMTPPIDCKAVCLFSGFATGSCTSVNDFDGSTGCICCLELDCSDLVTTSFP